MTGSTLDISGTPGVIDVNNYTIYLTAHDSFGIGQLPLYLEVELNNPPVTPGYANIDALELQQTSVILDPFTDTEGDVISYTLEFNNGTALDTSWVTFVPSTRNLTYTPPSNISSIVELKIAADDGLNTAVTDTFNIITDFIPKINTAVASNLYGEFITQELSNFSLPANIFSDETDPLGYTLTYDNGSNIDSWLTFTPSTGSSVLFDFRGTYASFESIVLNYTLTATDEVGQQNSVSIQIGIISKLTM